ncbi:peptide-methionine (S)-S-oxide reductase [Winogradskyella sp.]|uniref:peptide-methionine (S)-S-oxide reductase n=1 Tax=Winogradskyella sp. TaxID=1883156 RepID=UPI001B0B70EE|nr:peptide-methionine (S)-S-oxide reductase [Winogradskyella sp.]MBO6879121.1 peptide-methionine (S)-S-oxide reductase [Winogradskyella sp.]
MKTKIALGGGCHWCTEAVFQSLIGVGMVEQGYVASIGEQHAFSEAVIVHFNTEMISLRTLIDVHLQTHNSTSNHSMRKKYRSAIYAFSENQKIECERLLASFQNEYDGKLITKVYIFSKFKASREAIQDYYLKNPEKPFCKTFITPKLKKLRKLHGNKLKAKTINYD